MMRAVRSLLILALTGTFASSCLHAFPAEGRDRLNALRKQVQTAKANVFYKKRYEGMAEALDEAEARLKVLAESLGVGLDDGDCARLLKSIDETRKQLAKKTANRAGRSARRGAVAGKGADPRPDGKAAEARARFDELRKAAAKLKADVYYKNRHEAALGELDETEAALRRLAAEGGPSLDAGDGRRLLDSIETTRAEALKRLGKDRAWAEKEAARRRREAEAAAARGPEIPVELRERFVALRKQVDEIRGAVIHRRRFEGQAPALDEAERALRALVRPGGYAEDAPDLLRVLDRIEACRARIAKELGKKAPVFRRMEWKKWTFDPARLAPDEADGASAPSDDGASAASHAAPSDDGASAASHAAPSDDGASVASHAAPSDAAPSRDERLAPAEVRTRLAAFDGLVKDVKRRAGWKNFDGLEPDLLKAEAEREVLRGAVEAPRDRKSFDRLDAWLDTARERFDAHRASQGGAAAELAAWTGIRDELGEVAALLEKLAGARDENQILEGAALAARHEAIAARGRALLARLEKEIPDWEAFSRRHRDAFTARASALRRGELFRKAAAKVGEGRAALLRRLTDDMDWLERASDARVIAAVSSRIEENLGLLGLFPGSEGERSRLASRFETLAHEARRRLEAAVKEARMPDELDFAGDAASLRRAMAAAYARRHPGHELMRVVLTVENWRERAEARLEDNGRVVVTWFKDASAALAVRRDDGVRVFFLGFRKPWTPGTDSEGPLELHAVGESYPILEENVGR